MTRANYVPPPDGDEWQRVTGAKSGFDAKRLAAAVDFAESCETLWRYGVRDDVLAQMHEPPPYNTFLGLVKERGGPAGLILRHGRIAAEWGDTERADMTFSVTKSCVSLCAGIAFDDRLIPDPHAPVAALVDDGGFEGAHNGAITWHHLLQQTSEWEGTLWDRPDWLDHNRGVGGGDDSRKGEKRTLQLPGTYWEYNDVRVNRASLAVMRAWRRPLPDVFAERIMQPIGASSTWEWHGYTNATITIDGQDMVAVPGGGHWGGGMFISARDQARLGLLMLRRGLWQDRRLISDVWIDWSLTPCPLNRSYGYMWWLNTTGQQAPAAPKTSFFARGMGSHVIWVDPENDIVAVFRWIAPGAVAELVSRILEARKG
jgi:CubicO group peptidase (beta-lactamase class C family)